MDLGAYIQIEELESLLTANDIHIPCLRGLRLMSEETPLSDEVIQEQLNYELGWVAESLIRSIPRWCIHPDCREYSPKADRLVRKYLIFEKDGDREVFRGVRWDIPQKSDSKVYQYSSPIFEPTGKVRWIMVDRHGTPKGYEKSCHKLPKRAYKIKD